MILPEMKLHSMTIDRAAMHKARARAERNGMTRQLAFLRTRARTTLRRRKRPSKPGEVPSVHSTDPAASLKTIFFIYDPVTVTGIVGPVKVNKRVFGIDGKSAETPGILEHGGTYRLSEEHLFPGPGGWRRVDRRRRTRNTPKRRRTVHIRPRPFMSVALQKELDAGNIMDPWVDSFGE